VYGIEFAFGGHAGSSSGVFETKPFHVLVGENVLPDAGQLFFVFHDRAQHACCAWSSA
jgi:hypothetical protein